MKSCNGCKECCYTYTVPEMDKPRLQWCRHTCEQGCAIHDCPRPPICTEFHCYWKMSGWSEGLRPDQCGAIFRREPDIRTVYGNARMVLVADLRDRYADLWRTLSRHLNWLQNAGHVVLVSHSATIDGDSRSYWRFQRRLYPGLTDRKLMRDYMRRHAAGIAECEKFYEAQATACF